MTPQSTLENCIEEMGVWISRHPSGALRLGQGAESMMIYPTDDGWKYQMFEFGQSLPYNIGTHVENDIQKFVNKIQKWSWRNDVYRNRAGS